MRSSTVLSIVALAAAAPSLAAPVSSVPQYAKRQTTSQGPTNTPPASNLTPDESAALSLGAISTIAGFAAPVINGIVNHFKGDGKREIDEAGAFAVLPPGFHRPIRPIGAWPKFAVARADDEQSGAFLGAILRAVPTIISTVSGLFGGNKREVEELFAREFEEHYARELAARGDQDESGAFLGAILRAVPTVISAVSGLFGNKNKREVEELFAREFEEHFARELAARGDQDESGAFLGALFRAIPTVVNVVSGLFGNKNKRDVEELFAREFEEHFARAVLDDSSEAFSLGAAANIGSIISSGVSVLHNLFSGNNKREFEELLARAVVDDESGAIKLGTLANIGSLIGSGVSVLHNLFSGNNQNKREFEDILARAIADAEESGAIKLGTVANIGSLVSAGVSVLHNLFSGNQKREFEELFARALAEDDSGAFSLGAAANIGSIISSGVSVLHNLFSGNNKREIEALLTRAVENDESGAIKFGTLANIGSLIGSGISVIHNLFGGNNQQNKREVFDEIFARADSLDESGAIKLGTLANIGSLIGSGVSVIHNLFSGNNQNKREFEELLARAVFEARSLNELD